MAFQSPDTGVLPKYPVIIGDSREEQGSGETHAHIYPGTAEVTREIRLASAAL